MTRPIKFFLACFALLFLGSVYLPFDGYGFEISMLRNSQLIVQAETSEEEEKPEDPRPERKTKAFSLDWFTQNERITKVWEEDEDLEKARLLLDQMLDRSRRWIDAEIAAIHQRYVSLGFDLDDMDLVVEHLLKMLEYREEIAYKVEEDVLFQLVRIYSSTYEDYDTALEYVQRWLDLKLDWEEDGKSYAYIANIYARKATDERAPNPAHWEDVLAWMGRAIERRQEELGEGEAIEENWWRLVLQAHLTLSEEAGEGTEKKLGHLEDALDLVKFLVLEYIEDMEYWSLLSTVYQRKSGALQEAGGATNEEKAQLFSKYSGFSLEGAYLFELVEKENDYLRLLRGVASQSAYTRASWIYQEGLDIEVIEHDFDNLKRFGEYLQRIKDLDHAIDAFEDAVGVKDDAKLLYNIAQLYQRVDDYENCVVYADLALNATEGELRNPRQVKYLKGVCQFWDEKLDISEKTFFALRDEIQEDPEFDGTDRMLAPIKTYVGYIENQRGRIAYKKEVEKRWADYLAEKAQAQ